MLKDYQGRAVISAPTSRQVAMTARSCPVDKENRKSEPTLSDQAVSPGRQGLKVTAAIVAFVLSIATAFVGVLVGAGPASAVGLCDPAEGGTAAQPASSEVLQTAIQRCRTGHTLLVKGYFKSPDGNLDGKVVRVNRSMTLSGRSARLTDVQLAIRASDVKVERIFFADNTQTAVLIGSEREPVRRTEIVGNTFVRAFRSGTQEGSVIWIRGDGANSNTRITDNTIRQWGRDQAGQNFHAIKVGTNRLQQVTAQNPRTFIPRPTAPGTTILRNSINGGPTKAHSSAIQLNNSSLVRNNCITGSYNGISAKSGSNEIARNTLRRMTWAGLYQRDGSENMFNSNVVTDSKMGFWNQSGERVVFINNQFTGNGQEGITHGANHSGQRPYNWGVNSMPQLTGDALNFLKGETSFQFAANNTLFAFNTFDNDGDIAWENSSNAAFERPTDMWFYRNSFNRDTGQGKLMGHDPKVTTDVLNLHGNQFSADYNLLLDKNDKLVAVGEQDPAGVFQRWSHPDGWAQLPLGSSRVGNDSKVGTKLQCG